jgi:hypothetical protein
MNILNYWNVVQTDFLLGVLLSIAKDKHQVMKAKLGKLLVNCFMVVSCLAYSLTL